MKADAAKKTTLTRPTPFVIEPRAVFTIAEARAALKLSKSTIGREVRLGRLRVSKRAGSYYIMGAWLLEWIEAGEIHRKPWRALACAGDCKGSHDESGRDEGDDR